MTTIVELARKLTQLLAEHPLSFAAVAFATVITMSIIICRRRSAGPGLSWLKQFLGWIARVLAAAVFRTAVVVLSAVWLTIATVMGWINIERIAEWIMRNIWLIF